MHANYVVWISLFSLLFYLFPRFFLDSNLIPSARLLFFTPEFKLSFLTCISISPHCQMLSVAASSPLHQAPFLFSSPFDTKDFEEKRALCTKEINGWKKSKVFVLFLTRLCWNCAEPVQLCAIKGGQTHKSLSGAARGEKTKNAREGISHRVCISVCVCACVRECVRECACMEGRNEEEGGTEIEGSWEGIGGVHMEKKKGWGHFSPFSYSHFFLNPLCM